MTIPSKLTILIFIFKKESDRPKSGRFYSSHYVENMEGLGFASTVYPSYIDPSIVSSKFPPSI